MLVKWVPILHYAGFALFAIGATLLLLRNALRRETRPSATISHGQVVETFTLMIAGFMLLSIGLFGTSLKMATSDATAVFAFGAAWITLGMTNIVEMIVRKVNGGIQALNISAWVSFFLGVGLILVPTILVNAGIK